MLKAGLFLFVILFMLLPQAHGQSKSNTWSEVKENSPFIYHDSQGKLAGIEFEIMEDFVRFIDEKYGVKLNLEYEHLYNFESLLDTLKNSRSLYARY